PRRAAFPFHGPSRRPRSPRPPCAGTRSTAPLPPPAPHRDTAHRPAHTWLPEARPAPLQRDVVHRRNTASLSGQPDRAREPEQQTQEEPEHQRPAQQQRQERPRDHDDPERRRPAPPPSMELPGALSTRRR